MKHYFVKRGDFANVYTLIYTTDAKQDGVAISQGFERITRHEAFHLCAIENDRRKYDSAFSGFADNKIYPFGWDDGQYPQHVEGYIVLG